VLFFFLVRRDEGGTGFVIVIMSLPTFLPKMEGGDYYANSSLLDLESFLGYCLGWMWAGGF
jgi:hypothetical protein